MGRVLRWSFQSLLDERVPRPPRLNRPNKGAPSSRRRRRRCIALLLTQLYAPSQHLSYFGVRLNLRETERKRRRKVDDPSQSASAGAGSSTGGSSARNDKRRGGGDEDDED